MIDRLQFIHCNELFPTREEAIDYLKKRRADGNLSLYAEPVVLKYGTSPEDEHVILGIGAFTNTDENGGGYPENNKYCIIDIDKTEKEITELGDKIDNAVASVYLSVADTKTMSLAVTQGEDAKVLTADVKLPRAHAFETAMVPNKLIATDNGLFVYVNLEYDDRDNKFIFTVNDETTEVELPFDNIIGGEYDVRDESLHLKRNSGNDIVISMKELLGEWETEGLLSPTPIVLTREEVTYNDSVHSSSHKDILKGDVRIATDKEDNILQKVNQGRELYVKGSADNITYVKNGQKISLQEALDNQMGISGDFGNIIFKKNDGIFATCDLRYEVTSNTLVFVSSKVNGEITQKEVKLNTFSIFESVTYDPTEETLTIWYKDTNNDLKSVVIPVSSLIEEWETVPTGTTTVDLTKRRDVSGKDVLSASANIASKSDFPNQILEVKNHALLVDGTASNIAYGDATVKDALDALNAKDVADKDDIEKIYKIIGSGFTDDAHETITHKFDDLSERMVNAEDGIASLSATTDYLSDELQAEIDRATNAENTISSGLQAEIDRATGSEGALSERISSVEGDLQAEVDRATERENEIAQSVSDVSDGLAQEIARATNAEKTLSDTIGDAFGTAETQTVSWVVTNGLSNLGTRISDEIDRAQANEAILLSKIDSEIERSKAVDSVIGTRFTSSSTITDAVNTIDGELANIGLTYDAATNTLYFKGADGETKMIRLLSKSIVSSIRYDRDTESLIIVYKVNDEDMVVTVPLSSLIEEWRTENTSSVTLIKERHADGASDVLTAAVNINTVHDDNLLVDDGGLYVSGKAIKDAEDAIAEMRALIDGMSGDTADISGLKVRVTALEGTTSNLATAISTETANRISGDSSLANTISDVRGALSTEASERTNTDARLENLISLLGNKVNDLSDAVDGLESVGVDDTRTIDLTKEGGVIKGDVKIANSNDNIIKSSTDSEGLYATVGLEYDGLTNKLTLTTTNGTKELQLAGASIIKAMSYDPDHKEIVITYDSSDGAPTQEIRVGVADMLDDWDVAKGNHDGAIRLHKTYDQAQGEYILSAEVVISDRADNRLVNDNGVLYVAAGTDYSGDISDLQAELDRTQKGGGLNEDGTYTPNGNTYYINNATSLANADDKLDEAIKDLSGKVESLDLIETSDTKSVKMHKTSSGDTKVISSDVKLAVKGGERVDVSYLSSDDMPDTNLLRISEIAGSDGSNPSNGVYFDGSIDYGELEGINTLNG